MGECKKCPWEDIVGRGKRDKAFKDDLNKLFQVIKLNHNISQHMIIAQFADYLERVEGELISGDTINAYLQGRANFPFSIALTLLRFLSDFDNGKRRKYPEVLDFIREWYFPMIPTLQKFLDSAKELKEELEKKAQRYNCKFILD